MVDQAIRHMLVSKIEPCMSQYRLLCGETAAGAAAAAAAAIAVAAAAAAIAVVGVAVAPAVAAAVIVVGVVDNWCCCGCYC